MIYITPYFEILLEFKLCNGIVKILKNRRSFVNYITIVCSLTDGEKERPHQCEMVARDQCQRQFPRPTGQPQESDPVRRHFSAKTTFRVTLLYCFFFLLRSKVFFHKKMNLMDHK